MKRLYERLAESGRITFEVESHDGDALAMIQIQAGRDIVVNEIVCIIERQLTVLLAGKDQAYGWTVRYIQDMDINAPSSGSVSWKTAMGIPLDRDVHCVPITLRCIVEKSLRDKDYDADKTPSPKVSHPPRKKNKVYDTSKSPVKPPPPLPFDVILTNPPRVGPNLKIDQRGTSSLC